MDPEREEGPVATANCSFPLTRRHPDIRLDHRLWLSCEGLSTSYEAQVALPFAIDPRQWRLSGGHDQDPIPGTPDYYLETDQKQVMFPRRDLPSSNPRFKIWMSINSASRLPVLERLGKRYAGKLTDLIILVVPHLLSDFPYFAQSLVEAGAKVEDIYVIGIPYSARQDVIDHLKRMEFPEVHVPNEYSEMHEEIDRAFVWLRGRCREKEADGQPFRWAVIEDGGYIVPALHVGNGLETYESLAHLRECCIGAVEQTRNGIWMYQDKVVSDQRTIPVVSVAESRIKLELESRWIGEAVCTNILDLIVKTHPHSRVQSQPALVIGAGATGCQIAEVLTSNYQVDLFDTSPLARSIARARSLHVLDPDVTLSQAVRRRSLVVAATGRKNVIGLEEIRNMDDGTFVVNASSKRMEINWEELGELDTPEQMGPAKIYYLPHPTGRGKYILFLAEGYPVNFYTGNSVPARNIEVIMACLFRAAVEFVIDSDRPKEQRKFQLQAAPQEIAQESRRAILDFPEELQNEVAGIWEQSLHA